MQNYLLSGHADTGESMRWEASEKKIKQEVKEGLEKPAKEPKGNHSPICDSAKGPGDHPL